MNISETGQKNSLEATSVSILMPMLNPGIYLEAAVDSVLSQSYRNIELIIVDDGCTDNSRDLVEKIHDERIIIVDGPKRGVAAALNAGIRVSSGEIVMRCDADDFYTDQRIKNQIDWMDAHPGYAAMCGQFAAVSKNGRVRSLALNHHLEKACDINDELLAGRLRTSLCTFAIRKTAIEKSEGFREWFKTSEDIDFALRLSDYGAVYFNPELYYLYRLHSASTSHSQESNIRVFFEQSAIDFRIERTLGGTDRLEQNTPPSAPPVEISAHNAMISANDQLRGIMCGQAWRLNSSGKIRESILIALNLIKLNPLALSAWKTLGLLMIKSFTKLKTKQSRL